MRWAGRRPTPRRPLAVDRRRPADIWPGDSRRKTKTTRRPTADQNLAADTRPSASHTLPPCRSPSPGRSRAGRALNRPPPKTRRLEPAHSLVVDHTPTTARIGRTDHTLGDPDRPALGHILEIGRILKAGRSRGAGHFPQIGRSRTTGCTSGRSRTSAKARTLAAARSPAAGRRWGADYNFEPNGRLGSVRRREPDRWFGLVRKPAASRTTAAKPRRRGAAARLRIHFEERRSQ